MTLRCKEGDLALIVYDEPECAANIGKLVEVRGPLMFNSDYQKHCWLIRPVQEGTWRVERLGKVYDETVDWHHLVEHPDAWMMPIRPSQDFDVCETQRAAQPANAEETSGVLERTPEPTLH